MHETSEDQLAWWGFFADEHVEGRGCYLAPLRSLSRTRTGKLPLSDRLLHDGEYARGSVNTNWRNGVAHESCLILGTSEAGF